MALRSSADATRRTSTYRRCMSTTANPTRVLIAGGGVAALELLLALRAVAGSRVRITLLTADAQFTPRAMTVAEPFERGGAQAYDWAQIARDCDARLVVDQLVAVDTDARIAYTRSGSRVRYDTIALTTGARRVEPVAGALTFGMGRTPSARLRAMIADVAARENASIAFALPFPSCWPLPLYELALLTAHELREQGSDATISLVTPEQEPLALFGPAAAGAIRPLLETLGIDLVLGAQPRELAAAGALLDSGEVIAADHIVTLADVVARPIPGLPLDLLGFVPVDAHGRVAGERGVYAAGEATSFPLRQGGLAAQQADAVAEAIAAEAGAGNDPQPFEAVLRGRLLTSGAPLYLQARTNRQSLASFRALWAPPAKIAGRYLAPYLATARPSRTGALQERVPAIAGDPGGDRDAVTLALAIALAEAACHNPIRARQALEAAQALDGIAQPPGPPATWTRPESVGEKRVAGIALPD
jgi:sulfide:quinone oxidoreductase